MYEKAPSVSFGGKYDGLYIYWLCWFWLCVTVQPLPKGDQVLNFSDAEQMVDDVKLK